MVDRVRTTLEAVARGRQRVLAVRARESEATKVLCNAFYATKVQLFNEFYNIVRREGISYDTVRQLMVQQGWIHPMHTQVPGADGHLGVGGACLPKDTRALTQWADAAGVVCPLLRNAVCEATYVNGGRCCVCMYVFFYEKNTSGARQRTGSYY